MAETEVQLKEAHDATQDDVRSCDALIIGSPVRQRTADARIKQFIETVCEQLWLTDEMVGKVGGVFTVGGGYGNCGAGCKLAQLGLLGAMAAGGMILVTLPKTTPGFEVAGMHWGVHGRSGGAAMEPISITDEMKLAGTITGQTSLELQPNCKAKIYWLSATLPRLQNFSSNSPKLQVNHVYRFTQTIMSTHSLPSNLAAFRDSYATLFGSVPPLPATKFEFSADVDPDALRLAEQLRAHAFDSDVFDTKTTQLILFGMLVAQGSGAAKFHAIASRRAGATWEELHKVMELAAAVAALGPFNNGSALLNEIRANE